MRLRGVQVGQLTAADVTSLLDDQVPESRLLDYKESLPNFADKIAQQGEGPAKLKFIKDVAAFANTASGTIVYGVRCKPANPMGDSRYPTEIIGVGAINIDQFVLQAEQIVRAGIDPRPDALLWQSVVLATGQIVLVLGIAQSQRAPHAICLRDVPQQGGIWIAARSATTWPVWTRYVRWYWNSMHHGQP